ncbi:MAG: hypothetical protein QOJ43_2163 [Gaiellaceae bacterium]|nr:hypothetical protein [Gaiellaceae bacterium]
MRVLGACLVLLAAGCARESDDELSLPRGQTFAASTSITPQTSAFGDPLTARLRILVDRNEIDPDTIRVLSFFQPWSDRTTTERVDAGNITALTYTTQLRCLTLSCTSRDQRELTFRFGARIVSDVRPVQQVRWPEVSVVTRIPVETGPAENTGETPNEWPPPWRAAVSLPDVSYRAPPAPLAWGLGVLGALLVAAAAAGGWRLLRRGRLLSAREVPALERALQLLRSAQSDEERRAALEALALALETELEPKLAKPVRQLAWSQGRPTESAAAELAALAEDRQ